MPAPKINTAESAKAEKAMFAYIKTVNLFTNILTAYQPAAVPPKYIYEKRKRLLLILCIDLGLNTSQHNYNRLLYYLHSITFAHFTKMKAVF